VSAGGGGRRWGRTRWGWQVAAVSAARLPFAPLHRPCLIHPSPSHPPTPSLTPHPTPPHPTPPHPTPPHPTPPHPTPPHPTPPHPTPRPYDTLEEVIGLRGTPGHGSLAEWGVSYRELALAPGGGIDWAALEKAVVPGKTKVAHVQRSCGYALRPTLSIAEIERIVRIVKAQVRRGAPQGQPSACLAYCLRMRLPSQHHLFTTESCPRHHLTTRPPTPQDPNCVVVVDNCYGEFTEDREPPAVGADLAMGSLIKNGGGTLAPGGGYVAGRADLIGAVAARLAAPGIGIDAGGVSGDTLRILFQGLFMGAQVCVCVGGGACAQVAGWGGRGGEGARRRAGRAARPGRDEAPQRSACPHERRSRPYPPPDHGRGAQGRAPRGTGHGGGGLPGRPRPGHGPHAVDDHRGGAWHARAHGGLLPRHPAALPRGLLHPPRAGCGRRGGGAGGNSDMRMQGQTAQPAASHPAL
jgi:hypothetical protein